MTDQYYFFNREERNLTAILYHLMLQPGNMIKFLDLIKFPEVNDIDQVSIYYEYAYLRDLWAGPQFKENSKRKEFILSHLDLAPEKIDYLKGSSILKFNQYFGAIPKPSGKFIQFPGNWSILRFDKNPDFQNDSIEFEKICRFKWCFNVKPDIVIHISSDLVICIEAKYESGEGHYPSNPEEMKIFKNRMLNPVAQMDIQEYLIQKILGFMTKSLLIKKTNRKVGKYQAVSWKEVFSYLSYSGEPQFVKEWLNRIINEK